MKSAQKPQDIVILLKVHCLDSMWTYDDLAKSLKTSASVVYEALQRCEQCHLYNSNRRKVLKSAVEADPSFYELLCLVDSLRVGKVREQELAAQELKKRLYESSV
jgi:uncharacterized protein HemY